MLHIGVRDLLRLSSVEETLTALSVLAEVLIWAAYSICDSALRRELGIGSDVLTGFTVLAMGKLGGSELNFSSDVDLIYVYASDQEEVAAIYTPEYFRRLSQKITAALNEFTSEGYVYRVDLRLRPEGDAGLMANSLTGFQRYWQTRLATWERLALLKARPVAGDRKLGRAFILMAHPFVYDLPFGSDALAEVRSMKRKIDQKMAIREELGRNVKLGTGGIREIELIAQSFQVCYGGRVIQVRERETLKALRILLDQSLLSAEEHATLAQAYVFLRDVENKLQMVNDAQTHSLPQKQMELTACARLLGYTDDAGGHAAEHLLNDYRRHTSRVNRIFEAVLGADGAARFTQNR
jgi:glutamate-ammonia-ligase adenylyltransferase